MKMVLRVMTSIVALTKIYIHTIAIIISTFAKCPNETNFYAQKACCCVLHWTLWTCVFYAQKACCCVLHWTLWACLELVFYMTFAPLMCKTIFCQVCYVLCWVFILHKLIFGRSKGHHLCHCLKASLEFCLFSYL
jgi:hypothetical protein